MRKKFYHKGIRFECQRSSTCCKSGHIEGYVYLNLEDRRQIANHLGMSTLGFTRQYTAKTRKKFHLKQTKHDCPFLRNDHCTIYKARPMQCRTWPFWPENMKKYTWRKEVKKECPGIGKGKLYTIDEIEKILKSQILAKRKKLRGLIKTIKRTDI